MLKDLVIAGCLLALLGCGTGPAGDSPDASVGGDGTSTLIDGGDTDAQTQGTDAASPTSFTGTPISGPAPLTVTFTSTSTGAVSDWDWSFGEGGTGSDPNPSYTYAAPGDYTVVLTVTGPDGTDTETRSDYIHVDVPAPVEINGTDKIWAGYFSPKWVDVSQDFDNLAAWAGKRVTFGGTWHSNVDAAVNHFDKVEDIWSAGAVPFPHYMLNDTAAAGASGAYDSAYQQFAQGILDWTSQGGGRHLVVAFGPEMNGGWTDYGNDPANFRKAYRRFHSILRSYGLDQTRVRFAFAPNGWCEVGGGSCVGGLRDYYPGGDVVDLFGYSFYNANDSTTAAQVVGWADQLVDVLDYDKPIIVTQTGVAHWNRSPWVEALFQEALAHANVVGFLYFNFKIDDMDWRIFDEDTGDPQDTGDPVHVQGWVTGMNYSSTQYEWPLYTWFQPGPLPFGTAYDWLLKGPICTGSNCDTIALVDSNAMFWVYDHVAPDADLTPFVFGDPSDIPLLGDWNCNSEKTPGQYRNLNAHVYLRYTNTAGNADLDFDFGQTDDVLLSGDFNNDGCDTLAVYRPSTSTFYVKNTLGPGVADTSLQITGATGQPFVGDFNGDGVDSFGFFDNGTVYLRNDLTTGAPQVTYDFGNAGDVALAGDWNGDGVATVALFRPAVHKVFLRNSNSTGPADYELVTGIFDDALKVLR